MSLISKIEWTEATWNPVRGCTKVSPGCRFCYAEKFAERFRGVAGHPYEQGFDIRTAPSVLEAPLKWTPRKIFVNSMSDLFHPEVPTEYIQEVVRVMLYASQHTYQILTKRADRMAALLSSELRDAANASHIWWGVSVEDRRYGFPRVVHLQSAPLSLRFLSIEPLLEDLGKIDLDGIHWVIVGGESGPGARALEGDWVRSLRDQCSRKSVPFFFKQWGGVKKSLAGRTLDGRTHDEFPSAMERRRPL